MKAVVLLCKPGSRFHFGKYASNSDTALNDSDDIMHSDTLFSAIVNTYQDLYGNADELVRAFAAGQINTSSVFYCLKLRDEFIWFLPKPINFNLFKPQDDTYDYKTFKRIGYISKKVWEKLQSPVHLTDDDIFVINRRFALYKDEIRPLIENFNKKQDLLDRLSVSKLITLPKVLVRDNPLKRTIYQLTVNEIADNSFIKDLGVHYYFLLNTTQGIPANIEKKLAMAIQMLAFTGIGAERSTIGKLKDVKIFNWELSVSESDNESQCAVSLLSPAPSEMDKLVYYKTEMRGGRKLGKEGQELKSVRMILEGAIVLKNIEGQLADVSPNSDNSFLKNGKAFCLPVRKQWILHEQFN